MALIYNRYIAFRKSVCRFTILVIVAIMILEFYFMYSSDELALRNFAFKLTGTIQFNGVLEGNEVSFRNKNVSEIQSSRKQYFQFPPLVPLKYKTYSSGHGVYDENGEKYCNIPNSLEGLRTISVDAPSMETLEKIHTSLFPGGRFKPVNCRSRDKVAIIVPFRDRQQHLGIFLHNLHPFLQRQYLDYGIYIVEQMGHNPFNRAMLLNIGYVESQKQYDYDCFIFHDVDLIPEDDRNLYKCLDQPRHMSVAVDRMGYKLMYVDQFGGVCAMSKRHMEMVNGFSNSYWGWGAEDDDMSNRLRHQSFKISRFPANISRYTMLNHRRAYPSPNLEKKLKVGTKKYSTDGLNSLNYERVDILFKKLYTWILVKI